MLLDTGCECFVAVCVQACQFLCFTFHIGGMAAEHWEAVRAEGGVVWGEEVYSEDEPLGGEPDYETKETDPYDVKNWKKIRQEEVVEEKRAAALAEEEATALAEARMVEEERQAAVETARLAEQKTMKKRDWMADMKEKMQREAEWEEEKAERRRMRAQQEEEDYKRWLWAKKDKAEMAANGHGMKWKPKTG